VWHESSQGKERYQKGEKKQEPGDLGKKQIENAPLTHANQRGRNNGKRTTAGKRRRSKKGRLLLRKNGELRRERFRMRNSPY